jgi:hypothetical protein
MNFGDVAFIAVVDAAVGGYLGFATITFYRGSQAFNVTFGRNNKRAPLIGGVAGAALFVRYRLASTLLTNLLQANVTAHRGLFD